MEVLFKDGTQTKNVKIKAGEFVDVKGAIFKVSRIETSPRLIVLEPANPGQCKQFLNETRIEHVNKPSLSEAPPPDEVPTGMDVNATIESTEDDDVA